MTSLTLDPTSWRVLVIDDNPDNLILIEVMLKSQGVIIQVTTNPREGLRMMDEFKPNLLLLDLAMPGMDGWEVQATLRRSPDYDHIPIIALTALASLPDVERSVAAGFDGYITKPYHLDVVVSQIRGYIHTFLARRAGAGKS